MDAFTAIKWAQVIVNTRSTLHHQKRVFSEQSRSAI